MINNTNFIIDSGYTLIQYSLFYYYKLFKRFKKLLKNDLNFFGKINKNNKTQH